MSCNETGLGYSSRGVRNCASPVLAAAMNPSLCSFAIGCTTAVLLVACATTPPPELTGQEPAPKLSMGPPVELLAVKTVRDKVKAIAAQDGKVHVLIAATETRQVVEAVVLSNDVVQRRIVRSDVSPWRVDSAFDGQGRLHALVDSLHMVLEDGVWRESQQTPWHASGLTVSKPGFVRGGSNLIWIFQVDGSELNAPGRWEIFGMGGYGGAIVVPWFTRGLRTVVVAESSSGYGPWVEVEPAGKDDTERVDAATGPGHQIGLIGPEEAFGVIEITNPACNLPVGSLQDFLDFFMHAGGAEEIDYVHGAQAVCALGGAAGKSRF